MSEFDLDYELEFERELEAEEPQQMPPEDIDPVEAASASQTHATQPISKRGKVNKDEKYVEEEVFGQPNDANKQWKVWSFPHLKLS